MLEGVPIGEGMDTFAIKAQFRNLFLTVMVLLSLDCLIIETNTINEKLHNFGKKYHVYGAFVSF